MTGRVFGRLTVIEKAEVTGKKGAYWKCLCECGVIVIKNGADLRKQSTRSCGCLAKENVPQPIHKHGQASIAAGKRTKAYRTWDGMNRRCYNKNNRRYKDYGGRGIKVCDRWRGSFEAFFEHMGHPPTERHSIDRIDVDGNYEPANCRWATIDEQRANQRRVSDYTHVTLNELAYLGEKVDEKVYSRVYLKLTPEEKQKLDSLRENQ